ncbi:hypothetical protein EBT25_05635 [bacterium]|jgi:hypothetical protein|nr:hypothetical protein [bacterium]
MRHKFKEVGVHEHVKLEEDQMVVDVSGGKVVGFGSFFSHAMICLTRDPITAMDILITAVSVMEAIVAMEPIVTITDPSASTRTKKSPGGLGIVVIITPLHSHSINR